MAGVAISTIIMPAYRIAGITQRAMIVPSTDMYAEAIPELNRLLGSWNCDGHKIYSTAIVSAALTAGVKTYTIGSGGTFNVARPLFIRGANLLYPTTPVVRQTVDVLDADEWAAVAVQDLSGSPTFELYYDSGFDSSGYGKLYLRFQPPTGYTLELYVWAALQMAFAASTDVALLPPGYELALVYNLAKQLAALNPGMANMSQRSYEIADSSLAALISLNSKSPRIESDPALTGGDSFDGFGWLDGGIR